MSTRVVRLRTSSALAVPFVSGAVVAASALAPLSLFGAGSAAAATANTFTCAVRPTAVPSTATCTLLENFTSQHPTLSGALWWQRQSGKLDFWIYANAGIADTSEAVQICVSTTTPYTLASGISGRTLICSGSQPNRVYAGPGENGVEIIVPAGSTTYPDTTPLYFVVHVNAADGNSIEGDGVSPASTPTPTPTETEPTPTPTATTPTPTPTETTPTPTPTPTETTPTPTPTDPTLTPTSTPTTSSPTASPTVSVLGTTIRRSPSASTSTTAVADTSPSASPSLPTAVLGETLTRSLPFTGLPVRELLGIGAALLAAGFGLRLPRRASGTHRR